MKCFFGLVTAIFHLGGVELTLLVQKGSTVRDSFLLVTEWQFFGLAVRQDRILWFVGLRIVGGDVSLEGHVIPPLSQCH